MKRRIITSTEIDSAENLVGFEKAVELVAKAGFDAWDFSQFKMLGYDWEKCEPIYFNNGFNSDNPTAFARHLKKIGEDNGIFCNQSHAPFPTNCKEIQDSLKKSIELTAEAGGKICIVHPKTLVDIKQNIEMYSNILPFAKSHGVKIATENMWNWDKNSDMAIPTSCSNSALFLELLKAVNDEYFVACLDIGHAEMKGLNDNAPNMIINLNKHLQALHIHDNDKHHDSHQIPFSMDIDFNLVVNALKEINYKGEFTLEASSYLKKFTPETCLVGLNDLYLSVKKLVDKFTEE